MNLFEAIFLGVLQGATEFLPVSSSGHLVLFQSIFGLKEGALTFDVFLHFGTLVSVIVVFWDDIKEMLLFKKSHRHLIWMIIVGIIPTGIIGVFFKDTFERVFSSVLMVGLMLLVTGFILWISESFKKRGKDLANMKISDALTIGIIQGLAIIPGISRSGSTIVGGLFRGLKRDQAAKYSFFVAIPVIFGATLLEAKDILQGTGDQVPALYIICGTLAAMVSGYFAIRFLMKLLKERSLKPFAFYCWAVGLVTVISRLF